MNGRKLVGIGLGLGFAALAGGALFLMIISSNLPKLITVEDYEPLLVSEVYGANGQKIGQFFRENRILTPYDKIPPLMIQSFIAAEDSTFFEHGGINYLAIFRAVIANLREGRKVQGGSTITQQVAKSLLLSPEKTYIRKIREALLAYRMEANLTKEEILYLYLNQIYFGQGAYGVASASQIYFRKPLPEVTLAEMAILAGLPKAPSRYSPVYNPQRAKERQLYVLSRMVEDGFITEEQRKEAAAQPVKVYLRKDYEEVAPFYVETIRQLLVERLGETMVLDRGLRIYTPLDPKRQKAAQKAVRKGLHELDKRQGYRGPLTNLKEAEKVAEFLLKTRNEMIRNKEEFRIVQPDGTSPEPGPLTLRKVPAEGEPSEPNLPEYVPSDELIKGVVTEVSDKWGLVTVRFAESIGLIDVADMEWAREPDPETYAGYQKIKKPSQVLKVGDVIHTKVLDNKFSSQRVEEELAKLDDKERNAALEELPNFAHYVQLTLEQIPQSQASLLSFDQSSQGILAMVGGYDFAQSEFNRTIQAARQTGSTFKAIVYAAALDKSYTPATPIIDAPLVYEEEKEIENEEGEEETITTKWKPTNHSQKFRGDTLLRNALIRSLNIPTVRIVEEMGVPWVANYARRLGIFSPLNMDYTLGLGSSGVTLYEMTKVFAQYGLMGRRVQPLLITKVVDQEGNMILENMSLDERFREPIEKLEEEFEKKREAYLSLQAQVSNSAVSNDPLASEEKIPNPDVDAQIAKKLAKMPPFFFEDKDQLIPPTTAYLITSLLKAVVAEPGGTGGRARALGRPVAGKTGSTNGYYDGWFIGYTPQISTGVWVGNDEEKSLGRGEVGGRAALPIWLEYMKAAHVGLTVRDFPVPDGIVFANIDNETGQLASTSSKNVVRQAFRDGTEPQMTTEQVHAQDDKSFYKEDLSE